MEPLVVFGACLIIWCGYLAASDAIREWGLVRHKSPAKRAAMKKRVKALTSSLRPRLPAGISGGKPLLQRV